jgi:hypothetical protein
MKSILPATGFRADPATLVETVAITQVALIAGERQGDPISLLSRG